MGWGWGRGRAGTPPPPLDPGPPTLRPLPFKVLGRNSPAPPGERGGGIWGAGTGPSCWGKRHRDHSSLHSWRSQVAARTIFSSPGGGRGAAGRDEIELVGGEREESRSIRTQAAVPSSNAVQCGVWGEWVGAASSRCLMGLSEAQIKHCFPVSQSPYSCAQLSPPTPQPGPVCCADLTSAKSGDSRGH